METALITILFSLLTSCFTYLFTRKKLQSDIITTQIENNTKQLEFYIKLVDDFKSQVKVYMNRSGNMELEVLRLRRAIGRIVNDVCLSRNCPNRLYLDDDKIKELMDSRVKDDGDNDNDND